jgi:hypothetical protein
LTNVLADFFRCPEELVPLSCPDTGDSKLGPYGPAESFDEQLPFNSLSAANGSLVDSGLRFPFDVSRIVDNLRLERYSTKAHSATGAVLSSEAARQVYSKFRSTLPDSLRRSLQRLFLRDWDRVPFPKWPVDTSVERILENLLIVSMRAGDLERIPFIWFWPEGASSAAIVTHDVETTAGVNSIHDVMDVDDTFNIKTSFQLVPERRYHVSKDLLNAVRERQCEVNVHGLDHDGNLFRDRKTFLKQAKWINLYVEEFASEGFRSPCMYRNVDWIEEINVSYDMSVPNVAHLEPQRGGCCTVFPYFIGRVLELPLTTIQDYSLFHILRDYSIEIWKKQIDLIAEKHGLMSFIVHPDYILTERSLSVYKALLNYLSELRNERNVWVARPGDVNRWWRQRSAMKLVLEDGGWRITGAGQERARIGYACIKDDQIVYALEQNSEMERPCQPL